MPSTPVGQQLMHGGQIYMRGCVCLQATVQAALALAPRDAVTAAYQPDPEATPYYDFATEALTIAVFEILIAGTLGTLLIRLTAPRLLDKVQLPCRSA